MRAWSINIFLVGPDGEEMAANCFEKATYHLHESFGKRAKQGTLTQKESARVKEREATEEVARD